jgi:hypothetical protein
VNKKPFKTSFENGLVKFRNKEGEYTSYIRLYDRLEILFDSISGALRIKGVNDQYLDGHPFIKLFKQLLSIIEQSSSMPLSEGLKKLAKIRSNYILSQNPDMYRSIMDNNKFVYAIEGEKFLSDALLENEDVIRQDNYVNFILPLVNIYFMPK